ncbi:caspase family protein [Scytonema sp. PCC 10023]|uniref:caspase family protein n=1 Tax=Scytonema sp. PCC 10023 TaxID=1680591 RepID=UPI0039C749A2
MTKNIYALLVAIDKYHPASRVGSLSGCVNDIDAVEAYLQERVAQDGKWEVKILILKNQDATREAIINGFQHHLCKANNDDVALFYYAGHGSYETTPPEFWDIEQDRQHETIVCYDSRTENVSDLADKELGYLISKVAQKNPHMMVIMDCCHSATGTRDPEVTVRQAAINAKQRTLDSFIFAQDQPALNQLLSNQTTRVEWLKARHISLAACRADQVAEEFRDKDGKKRGVFSYFLLETLQKTNGNLTYQDLLRNVNALVNGKAQKGQSPQVEAVFKDDLNQLFLGGAISERPPYFTLAFNKQKYNNWIIQGGALHGIPKPNAGGNTLLTIFPAGSTTESLRQMSNKLAVAKVTQVLPQISKVEITEGSDKLSENETYWAVVTSLPIEPLKVNIHGEVSEEKGIELAIQALKTASFGDKPSLFVQQVEEAKDADYFLFARNSQYWITQHDKRPLIAPVPEKPDQNGYTPEVARDAILRLESIARWNNILELKNLATSKISYEDVEIEILVVEGKDSSSSISDMRLEYTYDENYWDEDTGEHWKPITLKIKLTNHSRKTLYCNVLVLSENYEVSIPFFSEESSFQLTPKGSGAGSTRSTEDLPVFIPVEYLKQGITEYKDILKLIVSTSEFDASILKQDGLNPPPSPTRSVGSLGILDRLMEQVNSRQFKNNSGGNYDDWMTKQVTLTYVRPQDTKQIKQGESTTLLDEVVELQPHPSLQANANLTTVPQITRDVANPVLPPILVQDPTVSQPFQFTTSRGSDPGLSVLELTEVENHASVTPETPLKLLVNTTLEEKEHIVPLAYDGEFYLPLGRGLKTEDGKTEIRLESLPSPTNSSRSASGSIKILFQKLVTQPLGAPFEYPILAIADIGTDGKLIANPEIKKLENIKAKVAQSKRILLYIHGIIGDTESLVGSVQTANIGGQSIKELYDLVLTFDYENLNTTIQENAQLLRQRLEAVDLGSNHGKELHIIAHSMGGLVSRWFIEREGGNQIVQHLIMLGTPNAGSPWPKVQDLAFALLGMALNQLSTVVWPVKILAQLVELLESNDNSLEQMQPNCDFLQEIAKNPDPHVPYTIIAGDRSLTSTASQKDIEKQTILLQKLMQKLFGKAVDSVINLVFFKQPNDIAVTLDSIKSVNYNRSPQPKILPDVACDHLSYFTHPAGLEAVAKALESIS